MMNIMMIMMTTITTDNTITIARATPNPAHIDSMDTLAACGCKNLPGLLDLTEARGGMLDVSCRGGAVHDDEAFNHFWAGLSKRPGNQSSPVMAHQHTLLVACKDAGKDCSTDQYLKGGLYCNKGKHAHAHN